MIVIIIRGIGIMIIKGTNEIISVPKIKKIILIKKIEFWKVDVLTINGQIYIQMEIFFS